MTGTMITVHADRVILLDPDREVQTVLLYFTPKRRLLTLKTVKAILATGFTHWLGDGWNPDPDLVRTALRRIRRQALAIREREGVR